FLLATASCINPQKEVAEVVPVATDSAPAPVPVSSVSASRSNAITNAVEKASPAIVSITVTELQTGYTRNLDPFFSRFFEQPIQREVQSMGSGFIISEDGWVV